MARRTESDPFGTTVGARIRRLRQERSMSLERLAAESGIGGKGHISDVERGRTVPNVATLAAIARGLECDLLDVVTFPNASERQTLVALSRKLAPDDLRAVLADVKRRLRRDDAT